MAGSMHVLSAMATELCLRQTAQHAAISCLHNLQQVVEGGAHDELLKIAEKSVAMGGL
jgi:hypothetical protein